MDGEKLSGSLSKSWSFLAPLYNAAPILGYPNNDHNFDTFYVGLVNILPCKSEGAHKHSVCEWKRGPDKGSHEG